MEQEKKKILIIAIVSLVLILLVGGYFVVTKVIFNNNETETNKEAITLEVGNTAYLSKYIENIDKIENAVFEKTDVFSINAEYLITTLKEGTDSLVVTYKDGTNEVLTFEAIEVTEIIIDFKGKVYLGDYVENIENIESTTFLEDESFAIEDNYIIANHGGIDELLVTYTDGTTETIRVYCNVTTLELEVGQTVNLSDYVEDIASISSVTVNDSSLFLVENNTIKALAEGSTILTVTYNDGETEQFDLNCLVKTSNASSATKIKIIKNIGDSQTSYYIYGVQDASKTNGDKTNCAYAKYYSDAALTKRIYQIELGYIYINTNYGTKIYQEKFLSERDGDVGATTTDGFLKTMHCLSNYSEQVWKAFDYWTDMYVIKLDSQNYSPIYEYIYYKDNNAYDHYGCSHNFSDALNYKISNTCDYEKRKIKEVDIPTKSGYTFGGYYTKTSGRGIQVTDAKGNILESGLKELSKNPSNVTLYAKWTRNSNGYRGY